LEGRACFGGFALRPFVFTLEAGRITEVAQEPPTSSCGIVRGCMERLLGLSQNGRVDTGMVADRLYTYLFILPLPFLCFRLLL